MLVNYSISFKALDTYVEGYNKQQDGIATQIRGTMLHTAKELIRLYGVSLLKSNKIKPITEDNIPSLRTNNIQMGRITKTSGRTIRRHIRRLQEAEIISKKVGHGSNSSYELWINPKILWIKGLKNLKNTKNKSNKGNSLLPKSQEIKNIHSTNCPHTDTRYATRDKNNTLIAVNKLRRVWQEGAANDPIFTGYATGDGKKRSLLPQTASSITGYDTGDRTGDTQLKDHKKNDTQLKENWRAQNSTEKWTVVGRQTQLTTSLPLDATGDNDPTRHSFLVSYAEKLWKLAFEKLYADKALTKNQHTTATQLLYQWYSPVTTEKLEYVHKVYTDRIHIVEKYIKKDPSSRFVMLPYLYFNPENPNGFAGTMPWYRKEKQHKIKLLQRKILREQIKKFKKNLAKDTAEARPDLTVYRECEQRIGKLGVPKLLKEFYTEVLGKDVKNKLFNF
ncbi:hypothetical protein [uncultured Aquimarina sp.]|uniref:hypothetical protein n=1 Tax=uncultured Aquimarina sp. TaxID=575652 RepID=UPI002609D5CE|nr:hypothetical protein [uncultured Aquimarina sp.]